jgi:hypothetical protein
MTWLDELDKMVERMVGGDTCEWVEGATPAVWKSTCAMIPFLGYRPRTKECPYCDRPVKVTANNRGADP